MKQSAFVPRLKTMPRTEDGQNGDLLVERSPIKKFFKTILSRLAAIPLKQLKKTVSPLLCMTIALHLGALSAQAQKAASSVLPTKTADPPSSESPPTDPATKDGTPHPDNSAQNPDENSANPEDEELEGDFAPLRAFHLAREIIHASESKHIYDWRHSTFELTLGYGQGIEANNFNSDTFDLGLGFPQNNAVRLGGGLRRTVVKATASTNELGRTPFVQESTTSRLELYAGASLSLLEGRSISALSTWCGDLEHVLYGVANLHMAQAQENINPFSKKKPQQKPGQKPVHSLYALELGLRMQIYTVFDGGIYFEALRIIPRNGGKHLHSWGQLSGGLLWSFP